MRQTTDEEVEQVWDDFWWPIFKNESDMILQIKRELFDYYQILSEVSKVYVAVTGGLISKPNTKAEAVIRLFEEKFMWIDDCEEYKQIMEEER